MTIYEPLTMETFIQEYSGMIKSPLIGNNGMNGFTLDNGTKITFKNVLISKSSEKILSNLPNMKQWRERAIRNDK
tara:strand:+ start:2495 stop:2719 length:225 start_codon:yes stop_codon:yes gene_type:complete